jgi:uncharacterized protein
MWLRDSANQLQSYKPLLHRNSSRDSLASLFRGAINLQARYIRTAPHCNAFHPPIESNRRKSNDGWSGGDNVHPMYDKKDVFECKYELDSIAAFLQLSHDYYTTTADKEFFAKFGWADAVKVLVKAATALLAGTYNEDGSVRISPFAFERTSPSASETVNNHGVGSPVKDGTGLVRSFFRPSDDSCIYQLFIPANMMFSRYLGSCAEIMQPIDPEMARKMTDFSASVRAGVEKYGKTNHSIFGEMYAYEVDGYGSFNAMVGPSVSQ